MKAKLIFNLPEDSHEFDMATQGASMHSVLWNMDQWLRGNTKHAPDSMSDDEVNKDFYMEFISFPFSLIRKLFTLPFYWFIYAFYFIVLSIIFALFDVGDRTFIITEYFFFNSLILTPFTYLMVSSSGSNRDKSE